MNQQEHNLQLNKQKKLAKTREDDIRKSKLIFIGLMLSCMLIGLMGRIFYIKQVYGDEYERRALENELNSSMETVVSPLRGAILDRNKQPFAVSNSVDDIILDVRVLSKEKAEVQTATLTQLNTYLDIPMETLNGYLAKKEDGTLVNDTNYLKIKRNVPKKISNALLNTKIKGVHTEETSVRSYSHDTIASPILGFIRGDSSWGLESRYNNELTGTAGRTFRSFESSNSVVSNQIPAKDGNTLITTIDLNIQRFAEEAVITAANEYDSQNTAIIVMNPKTGEVLAMAQNPSFSVNNPSNPEFFTNMRIKEDIKNMSPEEQMNAIYKVWGNYNISSSVEPGSIYKPIVVAAALEEDRISQDSTYVCTAPKQVMDRQIPCWVHKYGSNHGKQNLALGLANSCNIMLMDIGEKLGRDLFYKYQRDFGFGEKTGIDLPGEMNTAPLLHSKAALNPVEIATGSIGQGFNCTPIQAINAFAAIINGGDLMAPYIVSHIVDSNGNIIKETKPKVQRKVISQEISDYMRKNLQSVVDSPTGTGKRAAIQGYAIGGKTGTGEQTRGDDKEWALSFIAYLPVEDPEIIALVMLNRPQNYVDGVTSPVPTMRSILLDIIRYRGMQPTGDASESDNVILESNEVILDDYVGKDIVDVSKKLNDRELNYEVIGNGDVVEFQSPLAGAKVSKDGMVLLYVKDSKNDGSLVAVPDVTGLSVDKAIDILTASGLAFKIVDETEEQSTSKTDAKATPTPSAKPTSSGSGAATSGSQEAKTVYQEYPSPGIKVKVGTEIKLKVK